MRERERERGKERGRERAICGAREEETDKQTGIQIHRKTDIYTDRNKCFHLNMWRLAE